MEENNYFNNLDYTFEMLCSYVDHLVLFDLIFHLSKEDECREKFFKCCNAIFNMEDEIVDSVYDALNNPLIHEITNIENYNILSRSDKFDRSVLDYNESGIRIRMKRLIEFKEKYFLEDGYFTDNTIVLDTLAKSGNVLCKSLLSILLFEGILVSKNTVYAENIISELKNWNDVGGITIGLNYIHDEEKRFDLFNHLYAALSHDLSIEPEIFIKNRYGYRIKSENVILPMSIENAFSKGLLDKNQIDSNALKVINSPIINNKDKAQIIENVSKENYRYLPLEIYEKSTLKFDRSTLKSLNYQNKEIKNKIFNNLILFGDENITYKPLLFVCENKTQLDKIKESIESIVNGYDCETVDFKYEINYNFNHNKENVIISSQEKTHNVSKVLFFDNVDEIPNNLISEFTNLLNNKYTKNYKYDYMNISIDISSYLPILFSQTTPNTLICNSCNLIKLETIKEDELREYLDKAIIDTSSKTEIDEISLSSDTYAKLLSAGIDNIKEILYRSFVIYKNLDFVIDINSLIIDLIKDYEIKSNKRNWSY